MVDTIRSNYRGFEIIVDPAEVDKNVRVRYLGDNFPVAETKIFSTKGSAQSYVDRMLKLHGLSEEPQKRAF